MKTKTLSSAFLSICIIFLVSCASVHKGAVVEEGIPSDITKYKVLYTEINFENTASKHTAKVHNQAAKKHVVKKTGSTGTFINASELNNSEYADVDVYRYVLLNKMVDKVIKQHYREVGPTRMKVPDGQTEKYVFEFYFLDRKTGKQLPPMKRSTMPLPLLKAIVNKVSTENSSPAVAHNG
jgi:hypothetical protein